MDGAGDADGHRGPALARQRRRGRRRDWPIVGAFVDAAATTWPASTRGCWPLLVVLVAVAQLRRRSGCGCGRPSSGPPGPTRRSWSASCRCRRRGSRASVGARRADGQALLPGLPPYQGGLQRGQGRAVRDRRPGGRAPARSRRRRPTRSSHPWRIVRGRAGGHRGRSTLIGVPVLALASRTPWHRVLCHNGDIKLAALRRQDRGRGADALACAKSTSACSRWYRRSRSACTCCTPAGCGRAPSGPPGSGSPPPPRSSTTPTSTRCSARPWSTRPSSSRPRRPRSSCATGRTGRCWSAATPTACAGPAIRGRPRPARYDGESVTERLAGDDLKADLGEVRLHYAGRVRLTDRELLTLRTFASALRTAVRNASAFAEARRLALRNAHARAARPADRAGQPPPAAGVRRSRLGAAPARPRWWCSTSTCSGR